MAHAVHLRTWNRRPQATCPDCGESYAAAGVHVTGVTYVLFHCCAASISTSPATESEATHHSEGSRQPSRGLSHRIAVL